MALDRLSRLFFVFILVLAGAASAAAGIYQIEVKTGEDGTGHHVNMRFFVADDSHPSGLAMADWWRLKGDHGSGKTYTTSKNAVAYGSGRPLEGAVIKIGLRVEKKTGLIHKDNWKAGTIKITAPNGAVSTFVMNSEVSTGEESCEATNIVRPAISVDKTGQFRSDRVKVTQAHFAHNSSSIEQEVMRFKESFSFVEGTAASTSTATGSETTATLRTQATLKAVVEVEASLSQAWSKTFTQSQEKHESYTTSSEFDWGFRVAPESAILRRVTFAVPYQYALYGSSDGKELRWVRTAGGRIEAVGGEDFQQIPHRVNGEIVPISWDNRIAKEFIPHMSDTDKAQLNKWRAVWESKGYIYGGSTSPKPVTKETSPPTTAIRPGAEEEKAEGVARALPLSGYWMDGDGNWMELKIAESKVMMRPLSQNLKARMDKGSAKINEDESLGMMITLKDGDVGQMMQMRVVEAGKRINLKDGGRFDFKGNDRKSLPTEIQAALKDAHDAANPKYADLVAEIKSFNYGKGKATVQVIIKNVGDVEASSSKCRVFLTKNNKVNRSRDTKLGLKTVPNLAPGKSVTMKFGEGVKESKAKGMNIAVVVDYDNQIEEKGEGGEDNEFFMKAGKVDKDKKKNKKDKKKKGKKNGKK